MREGVKAMYSIVLDGKVLDYRYKKMNDFTYAFYVGDIYVGQVFRMRKGRWACIGNKANDLCPVHGFADRLYASEFILKLGGYVKEKS